MTRANEPLTALHMRAKRGQRPMRADASRPGGAAQDLGDLGKRESLIPAEDEHLAMLRRQCSHGRLELAEIIVGD